jgi:flagellar motility protein MotE (MotC chaperone)
MAFSLLTNRKKLMIVAPLVMGVVFAVALTGSLIARVRKQPALAENVKRVPLLGPLAASFAPPMPAPTTGAEEEKVKFSELRSFDVEEIATLVQDIKAQRTAYLAGQQELKRKEARLEITRKDLETERAEIDRLKQTLAEEWTEFKKARESFNRKVVELDTTEAKNLKQLAATYEGMAPDKAAAIIKKLDPETAVKTLSLMRDKKSAKVLENLDEDTAARMTERMALLKKNTEAGPEARP